MWFRFLNIAIGLWLIVSPFVLGFDKTATNNAHIVGPTVVSFSIIAIWGSTRSVRLWNYPLAIWLIIAPWILAYSHTIAIVNHILAGAFILLFSSIKGKIKNQYGGGWIALGKKNPEHMQDKE